MRGVLTSGEVGALERPQRLAQGVDVHVRDPRADVARPVQAVRLAATEHERAELPAPPRPARVPDDREILLRAELHLLPLRRPPAEPVRRVGALRDHALELPLACRLEQRDPVLERGRDADCVDGRVDQLLQELAALAERQRVHRLAVPHEQVEDHQDEPAGTRLQGLEARDAVLVEGAHLAVENRGRRADGASRRAGDVAEALGQVDAVAARQRRLSAHDRDERAIAVPLRLEEPLGAGREPLHRRRELGGELARSRRRAALAEQQPVLLLAVELCRHERPDALRAPAFEPEGEAAVPLLLEELVGARVPDLHRARPVLARGNHALERRVVERMILDVDREVSLAGLEREALRHGPARERPVLARVAGRSGAAARRAAG